MLLRMLLHSCLLVVGPMAKAILCRTDTHPLHAVTHAGYACVRAPSALQGQAPRVRALVQGDEARGADNG